MVASRMRLTVFVSRSWRARAMTGGPSVSGQAGAGAAMPSQIRWRRPASMRSARSIWWQAAPKFSPIGPRRGPRLAQERLSRAAWWWSG